VLLKTDVTSSVSAAGVMTQIAPRRMMKKPIEKRPSQSVPRERLSNLASMYRTVEQRIRTSFLKELPYAEKH
jgi:hypothetical protein